METLLTNKRFIKSSIVLVVLLSLFTFALFINEMKASSYIGRGSQAPATIVVSGKGEVVAVSDIATLSVTLTQNGATTKEAQNFLNEAITKTLNYLKKQDIADKDIKSEYGGINAQYSPSTPINCFAYPCPQPESKITGYAATQSITVKIRAVDNANEIKTGLASIGVSRDISGPTFSIDNEDSLNADARAKAIDDAREKAKTLARQLHVRLGDIVNFSENGAGYPMMYVKESMMAGDMAVAPAPAPELPKGENKITSNVTITYEIK